MTARPIRFLFYSMFQAGVAISFPIQIMWLYGHPINEFMAIWAKLTSLNLLVVFLCLLSSVLSLRVSRWLLLIGPLTLLTVVLNNHYVGLLEINYSANQSHLASLLFLGLGGLVFNPKGIFIMTHPDLRWWQRSDRKKVELATTISPFQGQIVKSKTFDLSETGAFIEIDSESVPFQINDRMIVCITLGTLSQIRCEARVARTNGNRGIYPGGIGLNFVDIPKGTRRELKQYIESMATDSII